MTEVEWLACGDPMPVSEFLWAQKPSERLLRLLASALCRDTGAI